MRADPGLQGCALRDRSRLLPGRQVTLRGTSPCPIMRSNTAFLPAMSLQCAARSVEYHFCSQLRFGRAPLLPATDADMQAIRTFLKQHACA